MDTYSNGKSKPRKWKGMYNFVLAWVLLLLVMIHLYRTTTKTEIETPSPMSHTVTQKRVAQRTRRTRGTAGDNLERGRLRDFLIKHNHREFLNKTYNDMHATEIMGIVDETRKEIVSRYDNYPNVGIRGLMSSGTNWLRFLFKNNCPGSIFPPSLVLDWDALYGWKHGLLESHGLARLLRNDKHKLVLVTRNAFDWTYAMRKMSIMKHEVGEDLHNNRQGPMLRFLNTQFHHPCPVIYSWYYPRCAFVGKGVVMHTKDILQWRDALYRQFYDLSQRYRDKVLIVRYEDLRDDLNNTWAKIASFSPEEMKCSATVRVNSLRRVKFGRTTGERVDAVEQHNRACKEYSDPKVLEHLKSNLDLDLERQLGYIYHNCT